MWANSDEFRSSSLLQIDSFFSQTPQEVTINGTSLTIPEIMAVAKQNAQLIFTTDTTILDRIKTSYDKMMEDVVNGVPIYGCNTAYGAQASRVLTEGTAEERIAIARRMSEGIAHVDVSVGPLFSREVVRAAMLIRINMLMRGVSGVKLDDLDLYRQMLNHNITPIVNQYGGIGASGDLAHNSRVVSAARQLDGALVWDSSGRVRSAKDALSEAGIPALKLDPKAGLGLVNGDNFSTALATLLAVDTLEALLISVAVSGMAIEVLKGTDRSFHPLLSEVRPHPGQQEISSLFRYLLKGSKLARQEMTGHKKREKGAKVQDGYSLRCLSQFQGVNVEKIKSIFETITINANSVSDNPLWVPPDYATDGEEPWQWVSGGNFIAMHMVEVMDSLRKTMTQLTKLNDRHLSRLVNPNENSGLSANLSDESSVTQCAFKGTQIQSGMFDVYSSLLSIPVSTFFGVHEENNQDITSHALTSGILGWENLRITRYSLAQNLIAFAQAVDLRGGPSMLSARTLPLYTFIRGKSAYVTNERPLHNDIESVFRSIVSGELMRVVRSEIFQEYDKT